MSNSYQATGKITHLQSAARQISDKFRVREFVIEVADGKYSELYKMQFVQDGCDNLDNHNKGDEVTVDFNIRGRQNDDGRVYTNLQAWRIASANQAASQQGAPPASQDFEDEIIFAPLRGLL